MTLKNIFAVILTACFVLSLAFVSETRAGFKKCEEHHECEYEPRYSTTDSIGGKLNRIAERGHKVCSSPLVRHNWFICEEREIECRNDTNILGDNNYYYNYKTIYYLPDGEKSESSFWVPARDSRGDRMPC